VPELPEVETMRRGILPIVGSRVVDVIRPPCAKRPIVFTPQRAAFRRRAVGCSVVAVERLGKRVVVRLDSQDAIVFEPRMTGLVLLADPPTREHLRVAIRLRGEVDRELLFWDRRGLGLVRLVTPRQFDGLYGSDKLGPDALALSCDQLRARLGGSRREIKVALLDQRALAGVGNLYASEILHTAGVHPLRRCHLLRRDDWQRVHAALVEVLEQAIDCEGSTLSDGTYSYQNHHRVYARAGQPCGRCGVALVERTVQAQRATFFCPRCQPRGRRARSAAGGG